MKTMTVSLLSVAIIATILFLLVWYLTDNVDAAKGAAAFAVTALPSISTWLEHSEAKQSSIPGNKMAIRSFERFALSLPGVVAVGTIVGVAILNIAGFFVGVAAAMMEEAVAAGQTPANGISATFIRLGTLGNLPVILLGFFLLGRWLSWRNPRHGALAVALMALLTAIINRAFEFFVMPTESWQLIYQTEETAPNLLLMVLSQFVFILVPSLLGLWRGRRERTSKYMAYLLSALPEETQNSLVDLAFEEVTKIVEAQRSMLRQSSNARAG